MLDRAMYNYKMATDRQLIIPKVSIFLKITIIYIFKSPISLRYSIMICGDTLSNDSLSCNIEISNPKYVKSQHNLTKEYSGGNITPTTHAHRKIPIQNP